MSLGDDLHAQVSEVFKRTWSVRDGRIVPESDDIALSNDAVKFDEATVLYADLADSTDLVNSQPWETAAEVYKSFLLCAARVIRGEGGEITAYDGDRIMAVFIGETKNTSAATAALKINYCVKQIVNPLLQKQYPNSTYKVRHVVGIDTSAIRVAKTGVRGANDLVWVGRAANYAAKLCSLSDSYPSQITGDVYAKLNDSAKYDSNHTSLWEQSTWPEMNNMTIYRSMGWWKVT